MVADLTAEAHVFRMCASNSWAGGDVEATARAIASSPVFQEFDNARIVARPGKQPVIALAGMLSAADAPRVDALGGRIQDELPRLRYIDYQAAQTDCVRLAAKLIDRFGPAAREFHYIAIPRGGQIVLGMLAYALELGADRLKPPSSPDTPVVIIDDCALSGACFARFLPGVPDHQVIFAHLCSTPELRAEIERREPRVIACVGAHDLEDEAERRLGAGYAAWLERQKGRSDGTAYWFGLVAPFGFPWNEPDFGFWNDALQKWEKSWNLLPPELCLKNSDVGKQCRDRLQIMQEGPGPLAVAEGAAYADFGDMILIGHADKPQTYRLQASGAEMWRALVGSGSPDRAMRVLMDRYDADPAELRKDLDAFADQLVSAGLLEWNSVARL